MGILPLCITVHGSRLGQGEMREVPRQAYGFLVFRLSGRDGRVSRQIALLKS